MDRDQRRIWFPWRGRRKNRRRIFKIKRKLFQWTGELSGGVFLIRNLRRTDDEIPRTGLTEIRRKNIVRIEKVTDDLLEAAEISHQFSGELGAVTKEAGEWSVLDRPRGICISAHLSQRDDVFVAENLDMRGRESFAKQSQRGHGENEITDRATANNKDAAQPERDRSLNTPQTRKPESPRQKQSPARKGAANARPSWCSNESGRGADTAL